MYIACVCLAGLLSVVVYGVVLRYVFNDAPPYVEQVALLLVISVAMFGAAAGVRDAGHIGMDSLVAMLAAEAAVLVRHRRLRAQHRVRARAAGRQRRDGDLDLRAARSPRSASPRPFATCPSCLGGVLITLFSIEHLIALFSGKEVVPSWH